MPARASGRASNLAVVCAAHHLRHLHGGTMRVEGQDPSTRIWEIGLQEGGPWRVWCDERLVDGEALEWEEGDVTPLTAELPEAERVEADERLVDGEALAWEEGDDRVCEAVPEYRVGPFRLPPEGQAA